MHTKNSSVAKQRCMHCADTMKRTLFLFAACVVLMVIHIGGRYYTLLDKSTPLLHQSLLEHKQPGGVAAVVDEGGRGSETASIILPPRPANKKKKKLYKYKYMNGYYCKEKFCTEYLKSEEMIKFKKGYGHGGSCHFINGTNRSPVALISFPGSGNTWVRGLLEKATGICTGSVYDDDGLRKGGFHGEGIISSAVLAVKTHRFLDVDFKSAILLIRNPRDAHVSNWNRQKGSSDSTLRQKNAKISTHTRLADPSTFGASDKWNHTVTVHTAKWESYFTWYLSLEDIDSALVVMYEDLKENTVKEVKRMLEFLKQPCNNTILEELVKKDYTTFLRSKPEQHIEYYTPSQDALIDKSLMKVKQLLREKGSSVNIDRYLETD